MVIYKKINQYYFNTTFILQLVIVNSYNIFIYNTYNCPQFSAHYPCGNLWGMGSGKT